MTDPTQTHDAPARPRLADLLLLLPFVWQLGLAPWANGVRLQPLGLPFGMVWQMAGIVFASLVLGLRYRLDRKAGDKA